MRLGIDFGTTRTVVAAVDEGRYPVATFDHNGTYHDYLPGLVAQRENTLLFGDEAKAAILAQQGRSLTSIKATITGLTPEAIVPGLDDVTALELVTAYVRWIHHMLIEHSNLEIERDTPLEAMVAVPASASTRQRYVTLEAFRSAGFEVIGLLGEPTAAAVEYGYRNANALSPRSPKRYVVVYDLGGGTFDTAAVSLRGRRFELICARGITHLGGNDFDRIILKAGLEQLGAPMPNHPATRIAMLETCRDAKEGLNANSRRLVLDLDSVDPELDPVMLAVNDVYGRCQPLIETTLSKVDELFVTLRNRDVDPDDPRQLAALYLVGGSSAFPALARVLRQRFKRKIQLAPQPHAATAVGLAVAADPQAEVFVREAVTRHFGVWREADGGFEKIFDPIISRDTVQPEHEPLVIQRNYRPAHPVGHLRFLECTELDSGGQPSGDLTPWEEIHFPYDPSLVEHTGLDAIEIERRGVLSEDIVETYTHDPNGTIAVEIENRTRGYRRAYILGAMR